MEPGLVIPLVVAAMAGGGFVVNEWSHGEMAEAVGLGHHHMLDYGGYHCAAHDESSPGHEHVAHMHGDATMPHAGCPGGVAMHGGGGAGMMGGRRDG